jgi:hypothetical protein
MNTSSTPAKPRKKIASGQAPAQKIATKTAPAPAQKNPASTRAVKSAQAPKRKPIQAATPPAKRPIEPAKAKAAQAKTAHPLALDKQSSTPPTKANKEKKVKVVRDSFTLPKTELLQIGEMKKRAMTLGVEVKKSELIRAGLQALAGMADTAFKKAMANVPTIKTGRPSKD